MKKISVFLSLTVALLMGACARQPKPILSVSAELRPIDSTLDAIQDTAYLAYLKPYQEQMQQQLDIPLGYAPEAMVAKAPESPLLNWASDALLAMADSVCTGRVDFAVVNVGGLRCDWPAGQITCRNVYELMPFDNELVILTLPGKEVLLLAQNFIERGGQGVSADFRVSGVMNGRLPEGEAVVTSVTLHGKPIDPEADYFVATSDYLSGGADGLTALTHFSHRELTGKKIRDLYIDYIRNLTEQGLPVESAIDGRMDVRWNGKK